MKTLAVFIVSVTLLFAALKICAQTATPAPPDGGATAPATPATPETPATPAAPATDAPDAQDVVRQLLNTPRRQAVLPSEPAETPAEDQTVAPSEIVQPMAAPPGSMIVNRLGRLLRSANGDGWKFHFESDRQILYEPPLGVLPNRMLEGMENILEKAGDKPVLFKVTGEVTNYRGQRFVLIRRMIVKRDTGAL